MSYPKTLTTIVNMAAKDSPSNIDKAVDAAFAKWRKTPEYAEWTEALVRSAIRGMVNDARHHANTKRNREAWTSPQKVVPGKAANHAARLAIMDMLIDGRVLGDILGKDLPRIAKTQEMQSAGLARNARLLRMLAEVVPADKTVREAMTAAQVKSVFIKAAGGKKKAA